MKFKFSILLNILFVVLTVCLGIILVCSIEHFNAMIQKLDSRITEIEKDENTGILDYIKEDRLAHFEFSFDIEATYVSDHTMINGELWIFNAGSDDHSTSAPINIYKIDFENKTGIFDRQLTHNLGHVNSIDYCEATDSIICGNGGADPTLEGQIYILDHVSDRTELRFEDCVKIDVPKSAYGVKVNVVWGEHNNEHYDIAYLISNDNCIVRKIQLKKKSNKFNGEMRVLKKWNFDYIEVNQGSVFYQGKLYIAVGHFQLRVLCFDLFDNNSAIIYDHTEIYYDENGEVDDSTFSEGIDIYNGHIILGAYDEKIRVYSME